MNDQTISLLRKSAIQFRFYAQEHLTKSEAAVDVKQKEASRIKSAINLSLAEQIEDHLRDIHNQTHPLSPVEEPLTADNMSADDWARSLGR
jgi:predicted fused transcriptional regulator/phosphomethylpyrimidine kinase